VNKRAKTVNQDSLSSNYKTAYDQVHKISMSSCLSTSTSVITEQSSANWTTSRTVEFGKEMKRAKKRKVRKLDVSTKKNKNPPRIVENIKFSPSTIQLELQVIIKTKKRRTYLIVRNRKIENKT